MEVRRKRSIHKTAYHPGSRVGRYLLIRETGEANGVAVWDAVCECGETVTLTKDAIRRSKGFACQRSHTLKINGVAASKLKEYWIWKGMRSRCNKPTNRAYHYYGGRGIKVCDRWANSFAAFFEDMGPRPTPEHSIERKDVNGDYEPDNCVWATPKEQSENTRRNILIEFDGRSMALPKWCALLGVPPVIVRTRIHRLGWSFVEAVTTPLHLGAKRPRGEGAMTEAMAKVKWRAK